MPIFDIAKCDTLQYNIPVISALVWCVQLIAVLRNESLTFSEIQDIIKGI